MDFSKRWPLPITWLTVPGVAIAIVVLAYLYARSGENPPTVTFRAEDGTLRRMPLPSALREAESSVGYPLWSPTWSPAHLVWESVSVEIDEAGARFSVLALSDGRASTSGSLTIAQRPGSPFFVKDTVEVPVGSGPFLLRQIPGPNRWPDGRITSQYIATAEGYQLLISFYGPDQPNPDEVVHLVRSMRRD